MPRTHDHSHFFKYTSATAAIQILESRRLLWSAPVLFNDPFDHQTRFRFSFGEAEFIEHLTAAQERIIYGDEEPKFVERTSLGVATYLLRKTLRGRNRNEIMRDLRQASEECAKNLETHKARLNGLLNTFLNHSRVLSVSERNESVVMWSHYADNHKGVVLKLECLDEVDDNLIIARPVSYVEEYPSFVSIEDWVLDLTGEQAIDYSKLQYEPAYLKHKDWVYEKEWRVHIPLLPHEPPGNGRSFYEKDPQVFSGVYFGCRIAQSDRDALMTVIAKSYPHMQVWQVAQSRESFALEFERVV